MSIHNYDSVRYASVYIHFMLCEPYDMLCEPYDTHSILPLVRTYIYSLSYEQKRVLSIPRYLIE